MPFILPAWFIWESFVSFCRVTFCLTSRYLISHSRLFHLKVLSFVWHYWMSYLNINSFMWCYGLFYLKMQHFISYLHVWFENVTFDGFCLPQISIKKAQIRQSCVIKLVERDAKWVQFPLFWVSNSNMVFLTLFFDSTEEPLIDLSLMWDKKKKAFQGV